MADLTTLPAELPAPTTSVLRPYPPSWIDRFTAWVDRLPGPPWLFYGGLWAILVVIDLIGRAQDGSFDLPPVFVPVYLAAPFYNLWLIHYLDRQARLALNRFRPALNCNEESYISLGYRLTTMPSGPTLLATIAGALIGLLMLLIVPPAEHAQFWSIPITDLAIHRPLIQGTAILIGVVATNLVYHAWHQLRTVSHIYAKHTVVDLFNQQPLYAFSNFSARMAIGTLLQTYSWPLAAPEVLRNAAMASWMIGYNLVCLLIFIVPLIGIHNLLKEDREERLAQAGRFARAARQELHRRINEDQMTDMDNLYKTIHSLDLEFQTLRHAPTWPWQPEVPRAVGVALIFPLILWLIQWALQRMLAA